MFKAFKYRLYPTSEQKVLLAKHFGAVRFIYNLALDVKTNAYSSYGVNISKFELIKQITDLKKDVEWLKEINSQSLQNTINDLDNAYKKFFKEGGGFPKFKSKGRDRDSFQIPQNTEIIDGKLSISKFREGIKMVISRPLEGKIKSSTISRTPTGKYYVSILCEIDKELPKKPKIKKETSIGIDLGISNYAITSDGEVFENPKYLRESLSKLKYLQRKYSKYKGKRTLNKLRKQYELVTNKREDFLHKLSSKLVSENQTICLEDLNVKGMVKNHNLALSISDTSWSKFVDMVKYKSEWYGVNALRIGRFEPSSKTCHHCGWVNKELKLSHREWVCDSCNETLDRDINGAINIRNFALNAILSGTDRKNQSELPSVEGVMTSESHSSLAGG